MRPLFRNRDTRPESHGPTGKRPCAGCKREVDLGERPATFVVLDGKFYHQGCEPELSAEDFES